MQFEILSGNTDIVYTVFNLNVLDQYLADKSVYIHVSAILYYNVLVSAILYYNVLVFKFVLVSGALCRKGHPTVFPQ